MDKQEFNNFQDVVDRNAWELNNARTNFDVASIKFRNSTKHTKEEFLEFKQACEDYIRISKQMVDAHSKSVEVANSFDAYKDEAKRLLTDEREVAIKPFGKMDSYSVVNGESEKINLYEFEVSTAEANSETYFSISGNSDGALEMLEQLEAVYVNNEKVKNLTEQKMTKEEFTNNCVNGVFNSIREIDNRMVSLQNNTLSNCSYISKISEMKDIIDAETKLEDVNAELEGKVERLSNVKKFSPEAYRESRDILLGYLETLGKANKQLLTANDYEVIQKAYDNYNRFAGMAIAAQEKSANKVALVKTNQEKIDSALQANPKLNGTISVEKLEDYRTTTSSVSLAEYGNDAQEISSKYQEENNARVNVFNDRMQYAKELVVYNDYKAITTNLANDVRNQDLLVENSMLHTANNNKFIDKALEVYPDENLYKQVYPNSQKLTSKVISRIMSIKNELTTNIADKESLNVAFDGLKQEREEIQNNSINQLKGLEQRVQNISKQSNVEKLDDRKLVEDLIKDLRSTSGRVSKQEKERALDVINHLSNKGERDFGIKYEISKTAKLIRKQSSEAVELLNNDQKLRDYYTVESKVKGKTEVKSVTKSVLDFKIANVNSDKVNFNESIEKSKLVASGNFGREKLADELEKNLVNLLNIGEKTRLDSVNNLKYISTMNDVNVSIPYEKYKQKVEEEEIRGRAKQNEEIKAEDKEAVAELFPDEKVDSKELEGKSSGVSAKEKEKEKELEKQKQDQKDYNDKIDQIDKQYDQKERDADKARKAELQSELNMRDDKKGAKMKIKGKEVECSLLDKYYNARVKASWIFSIMSALLILGIVFAPAALGAIFFICAGMGVYFNKILKDYRAVKNPIIEKLKKSHPDLYRKYGLNPTKFINKCMQYNDHVLAGRLKDVNAASMRMRLNQERIQARDKVNLEFKLAGKNVNFVNTGKTGSDFTTDFLAMDVLSDGKLDGNFVKEDEEQHEEEVTENKENENKENENQDLNPNVDNEKDNNEETKNDVNQGKGDDEQGKGENDANQDDLTNTDPNKEEKEDNLNAEEQNKEEEEKTKNDIVNKNGSVNTAEDQINNNLNTSTTALNDNTAVKESTKLNDGPEREMF